MMVKDFKDYIAALVGIPPEKQRLIFQGRLLLDHKRLIDYNVNGKVLHLVERPPPQTQLSGTEPSGTGTSMQLVIAGSGAGANVPNYELSSYTREGLPGLLGDIPGGRIPIAQLVSGLLRQFLMHPALRGQGSESIPVMTRAPSSTSTCSILTTASSCSGTSCSSSDISSQSSSATNSTITSEVLSESSSATAPGSDSSTQSLPSMGLQLSQYILEAAGSAMVGVTSGRSTMFTGAAPSVLEFLQGMVEFFLGIHTTSSPQSVPPLRSQSAPPPTTHGILDQQETCQLSPQSNPERAGSWFSVDEQIGPSEFFSSVLQGLLSSMMGSAEAPQGTIADFMHHLGGSSIIHDATTEGPIGFFQDLLSLICQHFSMVDIVMLPLQRIQPELNTFFREELLHNQEPTEQNIRVSVRVPEGLDITQTNVEFLQDHFHRIATHILHCSDHTFGTRLLELCNECLFQFIALNLHCLQEDQNALAAITFESFSLMLSGLNGSLVIVLVFMVAIQQQIIMEQVPVTQEQIMHYVRRTSDSCQFFPADGMPILLSEAVSRAADVLGITPLTNWECFKKDLEELAIEDSYKKQLQTDIQKRIQGDPEYSIQQFPNTHKVFQEGS
ncbi:large proline-rich protein bag6-B-like isoform X3 [Ambystoma mexicanum]|uniref:large proline-rich protein bag6-B-like isoform X3 n=1 Tax=Ambystoma mexicanum TaxID=8296 RepID=UPI0037E6FA0A